MLEKIDWRCHPGNYAFRHTLCLQTVVGIVLAFLSISLLAQPTIQNTQRIAPTKEPAGVSVRRLSLIDSLPKSLIDSMRSLQAQDSLLTLSRLNRTTAALGQKGDSLRQRLSVTQKSAVAIESIEQRADSLLFKATRPAFETQQKIEKEKEELARKLEPFSDKIPVSGTDDISVLTEPEGIDVPALPDITPLDSSLPKIDLPNDIDGPIKKNIPSLPNEIPTKVNGISDKTDELAALADDAGQIEKEVKSVKEGDTEVIEKEAERRLTSVAPAQSINSELSKASAEQAKYEALIQRYRDEKLMQDEIQRKVKSVANEQLAAHADKVQETQREMLSARTKISAKQKFKTMFAKQSNELESKKFYQRLVPGVTWQIYKRDYISVDVALQTGYRLSPRLTAGVGVLYRLGFSEEFETFVRGLETYGARTYVNYSSTKGIFIHAEFEALRVNPALSVAKEPISKEAYGSYVGLGKQFNLTRNLRGAVLGLYRIEYAGELPQVNKISARFSVEYVFRRPRKKLPGM